MRAEAVGSGSAIATANPRLDSNTSVRAHEAVVKALRDRSVEVRGHRNGAGGFRRRIDGSAASIRREDGPNPQPEGLHSAGDRADVQAPRRSLVCLSRLPRTRGKHETAAKKQQRRRLWNGGHSDVVEAAVVGDAEPTLLRPDQLNVSSVATERFKNVRLSVPPADRWPRTVMLVGPLASVLAPINMLSRLNDDGPDIVMMLFSMNPNQSVASPGKSATAAESKTADDPFVGVKVKPASVYGAAGLTFTRPPAGATPSNPIVVA